MKAKRRAKPFHPIAKYVDVRLTLKRSPYPADAISVIIHADEAAECFRRFMEPNTISLRECFYVMGLSHRNGLLGIYRISEGGFSKTLVQAQIVAKALLEMMASKAILCHNHPSGNLNPSKSDKLITESLEGALKLLDIEMLDHIIISEDGFSSYEEWKNKV